MTKTNNVQHILRHAILFKSMALARSFCERSAETIGYSKLSIILGTYDTLLIVTNREAAILHKAGYELA